MTPQVDVSVLRPDDLLNLEISAVNLRLDATDAARPLLVVDDPQEAALLVVRFPAQTTFEEAFFDDSPGDDPNDPGALPPEQKEDPPKPAPAPPPGMQTIAAHPPGKVRFRLGDESRLVFRVPADARIPYTIEGLLDWSAFELAVAPIADVPSGGTPPADQTIREPAPTESTLQLPFRLHLSPTHDAGWAHATGVVEHAGRAELWHTRLAARAGDGTLREAGDEHTIGLRAIWSPDYKPGQPVPSPGKSGMSDALAPMDIADRHQIVILTSAFDGYAKNAFQRFVPTPVQARTVMLSPLGGWLRSFGAWDPPTKIKPRRRLGGIRLDEVFGHAERLQIARGDAPPAIAREPEAVDRAPAPAPAPQAARLATAGRSGLVAGSAALNLDPVLVGLTLFDLDENGALDLSQWAHVAAQGRDHYVRIVYEGRFKDIGHRASLVKVTERRFEPPAPGAPPVAYLRQYMYIVVREPERVYSGLADDGRGLPFRRLRLTTLVTPHINYPYVSPAAITDRSFWVMVGGADFHFHGHGEDHDGRPVDFNRALIFVPNSETKLADINTATRKAAARARLRMAVPGQKVAYAPGGGGDNTTFATQSIDVENEGDAREAFFSPRMWKADVVVPAVEALTGAGTVTQIRYEKTYLAGGFGAAANKTGLFAEVVHQQGDMLDDSGGLAVAFNAQQAGGFSTPSLDVRCLTRATGPLGGRPAQALADSFVPTDVFKKGLATLFGVFDLADLVPGAGAASDRAPKMVTRREANAIVTELDWVSPVGSLPLGIVEFQANGDTKLTVHGELRKELGAADGSFKLDGRLNHFQIEFIKSLQIRFDAFTFAVRTGAKTDVNVGLDTAQPVLFKGDLEFVEGLRKIIPPGVFGDGVSIDLIAAPPGVKAGLSIGLPPAVVGVFSLKNVAFSAGLTIPFVSGKPVVEFGFARRDQPFLLAVTIFGGGGFFHIELDTDGMRMLDAAFEFGATAALDIGVASGEVHIMAGIYFKMEKKPVEGLPGEHMVSALSGYLRCGGSLSVLGIVRVSVEFLLSFTYYAPPVDKAKGRATLTVEIEVLCFSKSIELTVERAFGGKGGDPTFEQMIDTPELWAEYAAAYA